MKQIVLMTIGRSPRPDIRRDVEACVPGPVAFREVGALDALTDEEARALVPETEDDALIASLGPSRGEAIVSKKAIGLLIQENIDALEDEVDGFAILCTGLFPDLSSRKPIGQVGRLIPQTGEGLGASVKVGVLVPIAEQRALNERLWTSTGRSSDSAVASPYDGLDRVVAAARELVDRGADVIVMSCMTYSEEMRLAVSADTQKMTIGPSQVLVDFINKEWN